MKKNKTRIITIDGPAGAGKTTVSKALASRLQCIYVDTGSLYRGVAYEVYRCSTDWENDNELNTLLESISFELKLEAGGEFRLLSSGQDITDYIRTPEITMLSSDLSKKKKVRETLLGIQRELGENNDAVFEGRDMGTVVFPEADYKFFLFADLQTRALRRYKETKNRDNLITLSESDTKAESEMPILENKTTPQQTNKQESINNSNSHNNNTFENNNIFENNSLLRLKEIENSISLRDKNDSSREIAPLKPADNAIMIDSTNLSIDQVADIIFNAVRQH